MSRQIDIPAGTHIDSAAVAVVGAANMAGAEATATFNGITIRALPGDEPANVAAAWGREMDASAAAYRASPEGRASAERGAAEVATLQAKSDELTGSLELLDFTDRSAVLAFLGALQPCSDRLGVIVDGARIAAAFAVVGLVPNMCSGDAFDGDDEETFFRWLVGQALDGLVNGPAIHGIFHKFADEWRAKWSRP